MAQHYPAGPLRRGRRPQRDSDALPRPAVVRTTSPTRSSSTTSARSRRASPTSSVRCSRLRPSARQDPRARRAPSGRRQRSGKRRALRELDPVAAGVANERDHRDLAQLPRRDRAVDTERGYVLVLGADVAHLDGRVAEAARTHRPRRLRVRIVATRTRASSRSGHVPRLRQTRRASRRSGRTHRGRARQCLSRSP